MKDKYTSVNKNSEQMLASSFSVDKNTLIPNTLQKCPNTANDKSSIV